MTKHTFRRGLLAAAAALTIGLASAPTHAQFGGIVYDPTNYASNMLQAARALEQSQSQGQSQSQSTEDDEPPDPTKMYGILISVKSFLKFLNSHVVSTTTIACAYSLSSISLQG